MRGKGKGKKQMLTYQFNIKDLSILYSYCILSCHEQKNTIWVLEGKIVKKMNQRYFRHGMRMNKLVYSWEKNPFYQNNITYFVHLESHLLKLCLKSIANICQS